MLKTKPPSSGSTSAAAPQAADSLQDPLTAPPVEKPCNPAGITSDGILQGMTLVHAYGAGIDSFSGYAPMVAAGLSSIHNQWLIVEIEVKAGRLTQAKAMHQYHNLAGELNGYMSLVPDGMHPDLDVLKAKTLKGVSAYILRAVELEQAALISDQDRASVGAIQDSLMSASKAP
jgi:hypothetical protein